MDYRRIRELVARRKGTDPADLAGWEGPDLASLGWLLGLRLLRGSFLRLRLGRAEGLVFCERHVRVLHARHITAGRDLNLEEGCQIMGLSKRGIVFGHRCTVGRYAQIAPTGILGGVPGEGLRLGDNANIGPYSFIGCSGYIDIGARVLMGPRVNLLAENHNFDLTHVPIKRQGVTRQFVVIEDDCWLGAGCTVLAGVTVGHDSVVVAGAVVTKDVLPYSVVGGAPARLLRTRTLRGATATGSGGEAAAPAPLP
jgi:acetyltransferase-like isoleucine patch superfamily enzyme